MTEQPAGGSAHEATAATTIEQTSATGRDSGPFANVRVGDYLRDAIAVIALLTSLALPWDLVHRGSDRVEVVLVTVASLVSLALPYLARVGALPASWTVHATRRARVAANAPYVLLALVYLVVDLASGADGGEFGGVGTGLGLGLAGAALAAAPRESELGPPEQDAAVAQRWRTVLVAGGGLLAAGAIVAFVVALVAGPGVPLVLAAVLSLLLVLGLVWFLVVGAVRGDEASRLVLVAAGIVVAAVFVLTSGTTAGVESLHGARFGFVLLPALAAVAASAAARRELQAQATGSPDRGVDVWVRVAVRALGVVVLLAGYVALGAVAGLLAARFDVTLVLRLVLGVLVAALAVLARRSLVRDASTGHVPAVGAVCAIGVLGLVIVVATSESGAGVDVVDLLLAFGLPGTVAYALMVPQAVREHFSTDGIGGDPGADRTRAYVWEPPVAKAAPAPVSLPAAPARGALPEARRPAEPRRVTSSGVIRPAGAPARDVAPAQQAAPVQAVSAQQAAQSAQQAASPAREAAPQARDETQVTRPASGSQAVHETQVISGDTAVLPPVAAGPRWTAAQALDPATPLADLALIVQEAPHLRPHVAANPSTYPALLDWLGALGDPAVDAALRSRR